MAVLLTSEKGIESYEETYSYSACDHVCSDGCRMQQFEEGDRGPGTGDTGACCGAD